MAQVILIEENANLRDLLAINLKTFVAAEVIPRNSSAEVINLLNILPNVDLIITQVEVGKEKTAQIILDYIISNNLEIGLIVNGDFKSSPNENLVVIEDEKNWEEVISTSAKILGISKNELDSKVRPEYVPIDIHYFLPLDASCCDVFIRIKKSATEYQFIKRIHSGDSYSKALVQKYMEQGLKYFYVPKEFQNNFTNFISDRLSKRLDKDKFETFDEQIELLSQSYNIALKEITKLGFNSATIQLTDSIVSSMIASTKKTPEVNNILHKVINSKTGYLYQHGHMTSVVSSEIAKNLGMGKQKVYRKLAYASFFKDISFVDNEELAKITTFESLETSELSDEDWDLVFNHALDGALLIRKHPECPIDVDTIIKYHHGSKNGKGFSTLNVSGLPKITKVFLIAAEFVKELMNFKEEGGKPRPIVKALHAKYSSPDMTEVINALEETLKKKTKKK